MKTARVVVIGVALVAGLAAALLARNLSTPRVVTQMAPAPVADSVDVLVASRDLAMGTSLEVAPVSDLVPSVIDRGGKVVIVNRDATPFDDDATLVLGGDLVEHMRALAQDLAIDLSR